MIYLHNYLSINIGFKIELRPFFSSYPKGHIKYLVLYLQGNKVGKKL